MAKQTVPPLPLPKGWPRCVRSVAVHAIALARLALTTARGQAGKARAGMPTRPRRPLPGQDFHLLGRRTLHDTRGPTHQDQTLGTNCIIHAPEFAIRSVEIGAG